MQTLIVLLVLAAAALYLGRRIWRAMRGTIRAAKAPQAGCGTACGCGEAEEAGSRRG